MSSSEFDIFVLENDTPRMVISRYCLYYAVDKSDAVYNKLKLVLGNADANDIRDSLELIFKNALKMDEDFVLAVIKLLLSHKECDKALFELENMHRESLFERYMSNDFGDAPNNEKQAIITQKKIKNLLALAQSIYQMKTYGEDIRKKTTKGTLMIATAKSLRELIPTLETGAKNNTYSSDKGSLKKFKQTLHKHDHAFSHHRGWRRVVLNVGACFAGLGVFYLAACLYHYKATNHKHFFFFNDTETQKRVKKVNAQVTAAFRKSNV